MTLHIRETARAYTMSPPKDGIMSSRAKPRAGPLCFTDQVAQRRKSPERCAIPSSLARLDDSACFNVSVGVH
jgi:hypothetical protein